MRSYFPKLTARTRCFLMLVLPLLVAQGCPPVKPPTSDAQLTIKDGPGVSLLDPETLLTSLRIVNPGTATAEKVQVTEITIDGGAVASSTPLPIDLGTIPADGSAILNVDFSGQFLPAGSYGITVTGTYTEGTTPFTFTVNDDLVVPQASPGSALLGTATVASEKVSGAPFPPVERDQRHFDVEVNGPLWSVPTAPFVPGEPTPVPTEAREIPEIKVAGGPGPVVFLTNNSMGLTPGSTSNVAEPSGATSAAGGNVVFATVNWLAAYSTDGGGIFNELNPTTVFPADAIGFCCDQIVQYVPSIDRFVWLLQGNNGPNGYRLAVASPADIISSGGTAWTYWNLTPGLFGQPAGTGFDYPDLSVGNNSLYISWDAGFGCPAGCSQGFQVVRTSLAGLAAGGSITLEFTNPPDGIMAWGSHIMQNTLDEIFWAGHNSTSQMRVFSLAEGSGSYFWRDVNISSWSNAALSSTTPDGLNWLAGSGGFPGNAIIGSTRVANQLWFAWTASTDSRFQQAHVEMVTLDRNNSFNVIQQVQIWNNSFAFAYPALATNACSGEVGLSLEYGGGGNYENHVVGLWTDFLVYITTNSNVGTTRFGDYVTVRQTPPTTANPGNLFSAFGYGLNTGTAPGGAAQSDVHYVIFGRPVDVCQNR